MGKERTGAKQARNELPQSFDELQAAGCGAGKSSACLINSSLPGTIQLAELPFCRAINYIWSL